MKDDMIWGTLLDFFFVIKFQNHGGEHDQGLLWVANAPTPHEAQRHRHKRTCRKKIKLFVISIFHGPYGKNTNS